MPISSLQLRNTLQKPYDRILFSKEVLSPVFNNGFSLSSSLIKANIIPTQSEAHVISDVYIYGQIDLEDGTEITCYEVNLQPNVRIEYSKVAIQHYVRKLLTAGQAALINFVSPSNKNLWRLTLVAKDSILTDEGIKERTTHSKRYTYLLGKYESCKTAAERFEYLSTQTRINFESLVNAFSVEKLSKAFFDEYTRHYENFIEYLTKSNYKKVVFKGDEKAIRDFTKKLLGRIVFLYFVQKKGWLGASDTDYKDGNKNFIMDLFTQSGAGDNFYPQWLTKLFFDTLNNSNRKDDVFEMPDGSKVKIPFLNGGLFDKEEYDEKLLTFKSKLFHNHNNDEDPNERGFLDFLNAFNFTIYEDSPDEKTVAVDPEMLGHIFENLLEDNKDKGAFYTPKEIVHYMCQESLIEYLSTHLSKEYTVYRPIDSYQVEIFGNETRTGQLKIVEEIGDKALNRNDVSNMVKSKDIENLTLEQIKLIDKLLDNVKICDPAIGSGAFPMGLLLEIHSLKELIAYKLGKEWKPVEVKENIIQKSIYGVDIEKGAVDIARLRFWLSLVVDEDKPKPLPNLDYKIVVGDSLIGKFDGEIVEIEWNRTKVGPSGEKYVNNIKSLLKEVTEKQREYFDPSNKDKKKLSAEIRRIKIDLLINQVSLNKLIYNYYNSEVSGLGLELSAKEKVKNAEIQLTLAGYDHLIKKLTALKKNTTLSFNHFDWKLDFPEVLNPYLVNDNGGFDIVIANPPYIGHKGGQKKLFRLIKSTSLGKRFNNERMDIFYYFFHISIDFLKSDGIISFITTNYYLTADSAIKLRKDFKERVKLYKLINFNELKIFESALGQHNIIAFLVKKWQDLSCNIINTNQTGIANPALLRNILTGVDQKSIYYSQLNSEIFDGRNNYIRLRYTNTTGKTGVSRLLDMIKDENQTLDKYCDISQGIVTGIDKVSKKHIRKFPEYAKNEGDGVFVISSSEKKIIGGSPLLKPWFKNSNIERYLVKEKNDKWLIHTSVEVDLPKYPNIFNHLKKYNKLILSCNYESGELSKAKRLKKWWALSSSRWDFDFEKPKLVSPQRSYQNEFAFTATPWYASADVYFITSKIDSVHLYYVLGILNSKLIYFWLYNRGKRKGEMLELYLTPLSEIPLKTSNTIFEKYIICLVDYILFLRKQDNHLLIDQILPAFFEQIIDGIVYELYLPQLLQKHNREIIKHLGELPEINNELSDEKKLDIIKKVFNSLNANVHPVRVNLGKMKEIEEIKIIEGIS
ncbi:MAG: Eco57I restriction-modification methylase domain-containing protein [bacterium]|nr:Eco57I restriction-modification methylase domain-containing protein [bacterium]